MSLEEVSRIAPLSWRKACSAETLFMLPAVAAQPGLPLITTPTQPAPQPPGHQGSPSFGEIGSYQPPISDERSPVLPRSKSSLLSPKRPTRRAATKAKQRFSEVYAPLIIEGDSDTEKSFSSLIGANLGRPPPSSSWFTDSSDDDEYVDDGDDESDRSRSRRSGLKNRKGNKRPRTRDLEKHYAKLDYETITIAAGKAGMKRRANLKVERETGRNASLSQNLAGEEKVASRQQITQGLGGLAACGPRWSDAFAKLVGGGICADAMDDAAGSGKTHGRPDSDATLVEEGQNGRPFSEITLVASRLSK